jgi:hypothetical protein
MFNQLQHLVDMSVKDHEIRESILREKWACGRPMCLPSLSICRKYSITPETLEGVVELFTLLKRIE